MICVKFLFIIEKKLVISKTFKEMSKENWVTYELGVFKDDLDNASCSNTVITGEISGLLLFNQPRHRQTSTSSYAVVVRRCLVFYRYVVGTYKRLIGPFFAGFNFLGNCSKRHLLLTLPRMALEIVIQFLLGQMIMVHRLIELIKLVLTVII